jgi:Uma2 family endonuclease
MSAEAVAQLIAPAQVVRTKPLRTSSLVRENKMRLPQTIEEYELWNPKDGFKYEWKDGKLLKLNKMESKQSHIVRNLLRFFATLDAYKEGDDLLAETKTKTTESRRRVPDIAYFTLQQQEQMYAGVHITPYFAVEIISPGNSAIEMFDKLSEYLDTGVQVIWYILPEAETVYIFDSPTNYQICRQGMVCSAEKAIAGFKMTTDDIFRKPKRP